MSSIIYYRFLHQKNNSVILFDGTAISAFDLKREIILQNQLGQGYDFDLKLFHSEQPEIEYELDQDLIARSSYVLAKRTVSYGKMEGGFFNASRYVSGKQRINKKTNNNQGVLNLGSKEMSSNTNKSTTEEEKIMQMFEDQTNAWTQAQEDLANHKAIFYKKTQEKNDLHPPMGYICYRCGKKDHWIKNCQKISDPNFSGKKILRSTGIPKSYLKTLSKEDIANKLDEDGKIDVNNSLGSKECNTVFITEEGEYAIALADSRTWLSYQEKQKNNENLLNFQIEQAVIKSLNPETDFDFFDPLSTSKKLLKTPILMTPCCTEKSSLKKMTNINYNQDDLEHLLIESDFHCPNCDKEDIYIDMLVRNESLENKLVSLIESKKSSLRVSDKKNVFTESLIKDKLKKPKIDLPMKPNVASNSINYPPSQFSFDINMEPPIFMPPMIPQFPPTNGINN